jgi:hypothetical protein
MSRLQKFSVLVICAVALSFSGPAQADLLTNGDFETGAFATVFAGWHSNGSLLEIRISQTFPHTGTFSGELSSSPFDPNPPALFQFIPAGPGEKFNLSFFAADNFGSPDDVLTVRFGGFPIGTITGDQVAGAYHLETFTIDGPYLIQMGFVELAFRGINGVGSWFIDDVSLTQVPSVPIPAALPLFATGLGALGLLGWRRRRKG